MHDTARGLCTVANTVAGNRMDYRDGGDDFVGTFSGKVGRFGGRMRSGNSRSSREKRSPSDATKTGRWCRRRGQRRCRIVFSSEREGLRPRGNLISRSEAPDWPDELSNCGALRSSMASPSGVCFGSLIQLRLHPIGCLNGMLALPLWSCLGIVPRRRAGARQVREPGAVAANT